MPMDLRLLKQEYISTSAFPNYIWSKSTLQSAVNLQKHLNHLTYKEAV